MELEEAKARFEEHGFNVAAVMYDPIAVIQNFAARKAITFPMLSDDGAGVAEAFGILNRNIPSESEWYGIAFPGTYIVDAGGIVQSKFFEEDHRDRFTASNILVSYFREESGRNSRSLVTPHLKLTSSASDNTVRGGNRVALILDIELKPNIHVYAPDVEGGYIPIEWKVSQSKAWQEFPVSFPPSKSLFLPLLGEELPVFEGRFRLVRNLLIGMDKEVRPRIKDGGLTIKGTFRYQACNDEVCFPPKTLPLEWTFGFSEHDNQRVPRELRRH